MGKKTDFVGGAAVATAVISAVAPRAVRPALLYTSNGVLAGAGIVTAPVVLPVIATTATAIGLAYSAYQLCGWLYSEEKGKD